MINLCTNKHQRHLRSAGLPITCLMVAMLIAFPANMGLAALCSGVNHCMENTYPDSGAVKETKNCGSYWAGCTGTCTKVVNTAPGATTSSCQNCRGSGLGFMQHCQETSGTTSTSTYTSSECGLRFYYCTCGTYASTPDSTSTSGSCNSVPSNCDAC